MTTVPRVVADGVPFVENGRDGVADGVPSVEGGRDGAGTARSVELLVDGSQQPPQHLVVHAGRANELVDLLLELGDLLLRLPRVLAALIFELLELRR